jgi:branched-chain amino acid transport system permease protein
VLLFWQQLFNGLALGSTYAMFALGFGIVFSTLRVLNVAQGCLATWGAIVALWFVEHESLNFALTILLGTIAAGILGVVLDQVAFQPLRRRREAGLLGTVITSIGAWIALDGLSDEATGNTAQSFPSGAFSERALAVGPIKLQLLQMVNMAMLAVVGLGLYLFMHRTRIGSAVRAVGYDSRSAQIVGVNSRWVIIVTAFVAGAVTGLSGVLAGALTSDVGTGLGDGLLFIGFAAVVVGGLGNIRGSIIGGLLIGVSEVMSAQYISTSFADAITFGLLLVVLIVRPRGLFGELELVRA